MNTVLLIEEIKKTNKETLCELISNLSALIKKIPEINEEKEKKEITQVIINSLAIIKWNIRTM